MGVMVQNIVAQFLWPNVYIKTTKTYCTPCVCCGCRVYKEGNGWTAAEVTTAIARRRFSFHADFSVVCNSNATSAVTSQHIRRAAVSFAALTQRTCTRADACSTTRAGGRRRALTHVHVRCASAAFVDQIIPAFTA